MLSLPLAASMRAVLDTNVIVSGLLWSGSTRELIVLVRSGKVIVCLTPAIIQEVKRVLTYPHLMNQLGLMKITVDEIVSFLMDHGELVEDRDLIQLVKDDPTDDVFLNCAIVADAQWIVSGDKHLLKLKRVAGIHIVTPAEFMKVIAE